MVEGRLVEMSLKAFAVDAHEVFEQFFAHHFDRFELLYNVNVFGLEVTSVIEADEAFEVVQRQFGKQIHRGYDRLPRGIL